MKNLTKNKEILYSALLLSLPLILLFTAFIITNVKTVPEVIVEETPQEIPRVNYFAYLELEAKAAYVKDLNTGKVLYQKNADKPMALASLTKIMTVIIADQEISDSQMVTITPESLNEDGDYMFYSGESFSKKDLIDFTLVSSSNDAAAALAFNSNNNSIKDFLREMNSTAKKIGLKNTKFFNVTGLDQDPTRAGSYGTAEDISTLLSYALKNNIDLVQATNQNDVSVTSSLGLVHSFDNTNEIVGKLPNLLVSKTGYTDLAGGNLSVIIDPGLNRPISITVLGSSEEGRFSDVMKLAEAAIKTYNQSE